MRRKLGKTPFVFLVKRNGLPYRWVVRCTVHKVKRYVGCFDSEEKATQALQRFAVKNNLKLGEQQCQK